MSVFVHATRFLALDAELSFAPRLATSGATYKAPGGCWQPFCDASNPDQSQSTDGSLCGFGGNDAVRNAWRPEDLGTVLSLFAAHSQPYREVSAD